jgi:ribosomal RNA-processing protein 8
VRFACALPCATLGHAYSDGHHLVQRKYAPVREHCLCNHQPLVCAGVCDAVVLSLALMGSDYAAFLAEARRVLKPRGWLWIAEVRSRFVPADAAKEDFEPFLAGLKQLGFEPRSQSLANKMFVVWVLRKHDGGVADVSAVVCPKLKPCIYKRR